MAHRIQLGSTSLLCRIALIYLVSKLRKLRCPFIPSPLTLNTCQKPWFRSGFTHLWEPYNGCVKKQYYIKGWDEIMMFHGFPPSAPVPLTLHLHIQAPSPLAELLPAPTPCRLCSMHGSAKGCHIDEPKEIETYMPTLLVGSCISILVSATRIYYIRVCI